MSVQQARNAEVQAETAQRQLQLLEQQMAMAERTFEAIHRPHLQVEAHVLHDGPVRLPEGRISRLEILAKNYGATAATVMSAECSVPGETAVWGHRFQPSVIAPGETERIGSAILPPTPDVNLFPSDAEGIEKIMRWFHVYIRYRGLGEIDYSTQDQVSLLPDSKDKTRWRILGVTPTGGVFWEIHGGKEQDGWRPVT